MDQGERRRQEAKVLPAREALSLITPGLLAAGGLADPGVAAAPADTVTAPSDTHADASGGGETSVSSDDRSDSFTRIDSASSET